ncbi:MAG: aquaporin family protein [Conexibacter sp.]|nr:aquaporin family protein [Conexibacter sp.]
MSTQRSTGPAARWRQTLGGELAAEFLGTFILIMFGTGSVAMAVSALNQSGRGTEIFQASGDWLLICWGWGLAVTLGVYVAGGVTGAHLNPAVTFANALRRDFPWRKVLPYSAAQLVGAFAGAAVVYLNYHGAIDSYNSVHHIVDRGSADGATTFSIFGTTPAPYFHNWFGPFLDEVIGTALLICVLFALTDERNQPPKANLAPFVVGLVIVAIGISFGANSGYAINPARDLGPRLLAGVAGWGSNAVPGDYGDISFYMWIPIVGPLVGAALGAVVYDKLIRDVLLARGKEEDPGVEGGAETVEDSQATRFAKETRSTTA